MILATTKVEDFDRFLRSSRPRAPRSAREHGSKGAKVFRDPNEDDRVWVLFDWDAEGWQSFVSDPEVPPIMQGGRAQGPAAGRRARRQLRRLAPIRDRRTSWKHDNSADPSRSA